MNFSLTPSLERFVRDRARSGDYNNASEVVREALRLLKQAEEERALRLGRLRAVARKGDEFIASSVREDLESDEASERVATKKAVLNVLRRQEPFLRERGIRGLSFLGSTLNDTGGPDSDIDILIEIDPVDGFDLIDLAGVTRHLTELFRRDVDVLTREGIDPRIWKQVVAEAERVF